MDIKYERNLRGKELSRQVLYLNGHQDSPKFVFFNPVWFFMIISVGLAGVISIMTYVAMAGIAGLLFELALWGWYFFRTRRFNAYPGLSAWFNICVRRLLMPYGKSAGVLSKPR